MSEVEGIQKIGTLVAQRIFRFNSLSTDLMLVIDCILPIKLFDNLVLSGLTRGWARPACLFMC